MELGNKHLSICHGEKSQKRGKFGVGHYKNMTFVAGN
jgi:hypothetical protein